MNGKNNQIVVPKAELVDRFWSQRSAILGYIHNFVFNQDEMEDIFQEACLKFLRSPGKFRAFPPAARYLYRIIFTTIISRRRKDRRLLITDRLPEMICEPEPQWLRDLMIQKLRTVVGELSSRDRQLLDVHMIPESRIRECSEMAGLPTYTYRYQLKGVISKLRKRMNDVKPKRTGCQSRNGEN